MQLPLYATSWSVHICIQSTAPTVQICIKSTASTVQICIKSTASTFADTLKRLPLLCRYIKSTASTFADAFLHQTFALRQLNLGKSGTEAKNSNFSHFYRSLA